jgi:hypothetical protein
MIKSAIEKLLSLAEVKTFKNLDGEDGRVYTSSNLYPLLAPIPAPLFGHTLTSLFDYAKCEDHFCFLHIESHRKVSFVSELYGPHKQRCVYFTATHEAKDFPYGQFIDIESFIVAIQTSFIQDENTSAILRIVGNVTHEAKMDVTDNGYTQIVTAKTGIARVGNVEVPNPITLRPYRTFLEVENQPSCLFVFRMRRLETRIECALFEADAGLWKLEAIKEIKKWLASHITSTEIVG